MRAKKLGLFGPRFEDFEKLTHRDLHFASSSIGFALGLFGFVLALGCDNGRKMGVGLALFGFVWVRFCGGESNISFVTLFHKRG
jgi:hypothetical protein